MKSSVHPSPHRSMPPYKVSPSEVERSTIGDIGASSRFFLESTVQFLTLTSSPSSSSSPPGPFTFSKAIIFPTDIICRYGPTANDTSLCGSPTCFQGSMVTFISSRCAYCLPQGWSAARLKPEDKRLCVVLLTG